MKLKATELQDKSALRLPIVEVGGEARKDKTVKVPTARDLLVEVVNHHGQFWRSAFIEIADA